jgi:hypothetical protein
MDAVYQLGGDGDSSVSSYNLPLLIPVRGPAMTDDELLRYNRQILLRDPAWLPLSGVGVGSDAPASQVCPPTRAAGAAQRHSHAGARE